MPLYVNISQFYFKMIIVLTICLYLRPTTIKYLISLIRVPDFDLCARIQGPGWSEIFGFHSVHISNRFTLSSENKKQTKNVTYTFVSLIFHFYSIDRGRRDDNTKIFFKRVASFLGWIYRYIATKFEEQNIFIKLLNYCFFFKCIFFRTWISFVETLILSSTQTPH